MSIRGINNREIEGLEATTRFTLIARPVPLFLMEPRADASGTTEQSKFRWIHPESARS